jgi:hypothetical protein
MIGGIIRISLAQGGKGQMAWKRLDTFTDEDIAQAIAEDPDAFEPEPVSLQYATVLQLGQP